MRAILVVGNSRLSPVPGGARSCLAPLVDRAFLQHVVESILSSGVREIQLVVRPDDRAVRSLLGSGPKWGAEFAYTIADHSELSAVRRLASERPDECFLFAQADRLPLLPKDLSSLGPTLFCWGMDLDPEWTGWAVLTARDLAGVELEPDDPALCAQLQETNPEIILNDGPKPLSARSYADLVEANRRALGREFPNLLIGGVEIQPGVWASRNAKVHPTARLRSPMFLGEHTVLGPMVEVGPGASIGDHCIIERETIVADSIVYRGTYVGERLSLHSVVVDRSKLINTSLDAEIDGIDEVLLGSVYGVPVARRAEQIWNRLLGLVLLIFASPVLLLLWLASLAGWVPALCRQDVVLTPIVADSWRWKFFPLWSFGPRHPPSTGSEWRRDFLYCSLLALIPIACGHMRFVGRSAQTRREVMAALGHDTDLFSSHTGLVQGTLFEVNGLGSHGLSEDSGWWTTVRLFGRYLTAMMIGTSSILQSQDRSHYAENGVSRHEN